MIRWPRGTLLLSIVGAVACGDATSVVPVPQATDAALAEGEQRFVGDLGGVTFTPRSAIWGIESRPIRGGMHTYDWVVLMSSAEAPCDNWPHTVGTAGHRGLIARLSKLERSQGSATFVEPDLGTYSVTPPRNPSQPVNRGTEVYFRAIPPPAVDVDAWLARTGSVQLTEHMSESDALRGTFSVEMLPFSLDGEAQGPTSPISGAFTALRCKAMDDVR